MLEIHKQTVLVVLTLIACLAWLGSMMAERAFTIGRRGFLVLPIAFLVTVLWSTVSGGGGFLSWIGNATQEYTSALTLTTCVVLFFLFSQLGRDEAFLRRTTYALLVSALLAAGAALASIFGWIPSPTGMILPPAFNTVGTLNALAIFLCAATVIGNGIVVFVPNKEEGGARWVTRLQTCLSLLVSILTFILLLILDYWMLWAVLLSGLALLVATGLARAKEIPNTARFLFPMALLAVSLLFIFLESPVNVSVPVEITPSLKTSWVVAEETLKNQSPLFGSGPGTYAFDFAHDRPVAANDTSLWNVRFDRGSSHLLTILPTLGVLATAFWLLFVVTTLVRGVGTALRAKHDWHIHAILVAGWTPLAVAAFLYSSNITLTFLFFGLAGLLIADRRSDVTVRRFAGSKRANFFASLGFVLVSIGIVTVVFVTGQRYAAELAFAQAIRLDAGGGDTTAIVEKLDQAASLNHFNDVSYRNLSQALLERVREELTTEGSGPLSNAARTYIQGLTGASINAAVRATELEPKNAVNWLVQGATYRALINLLPDAGSFALEAYEHAATLEPTNPATQTELGKTYVAMVEQTNALLTTDDPAVKTQAKAAIEQQLSQAQTAFEKAIELKKDYAPAHYQLALVFEQQGRLDDAIGKMESVAQYNPLDVGVAFQLGVLYLRRGTNDDLERARRAFEQAVSLLPSYSNARWFLASIYEQQGNLAAAAEQVTAVFELNPENELVKARLERLRAGLVAPEPTEPLEESTP